MCFVHPFVHPIGNPMPINGHLNTNSCNVKSYGFYYSKNSSCTPTDLQTYSIGGGDGAYQLNNADFSFTLTNQLTTGTIYYFRAYAITNTNERFVGDVLSFTTL